MAHLQYFAYPNQGAVLREHFWYSQAVRIGDRIELSGQGGWDPATGQMKTDLAEEVDQAFANVDLALRDAGGQGWSQVYKVRIYALDLHDEALLVRVMENLRKWMPDHQPLLTAVGVKALGAGDSASMRLEIEVEAHDKEETA